MAYSQYGIGVTKNRFELFDIEEDPLDILKKRELEKEARKKTKLSEKENSTKTKEVNNKPKQVPARKTVRDVQSLKAVENQKSKDEVKNFARNQAGRGSDVGHYREERPERHSYPVNNVRDERIDKFEKPELRDGSSRPGRGAGRGGRGGRNSRGSFDIRGKREYERQSGSDKTGVKAVEKRDGAGAHNWGTHKHDLVLSEEEEKDDRWVINEKTEESTSEPQVSTGGGGGGGGSGAGGGTGGGAPNETEENGNVGTDDGTRVMTLDEWKALKMPRQKPTYNLRKAGEGEDLSHWKKMYALEKKKEGDDEEEDDDEEYEQCEYPQRVGRLKHVLDIDIRFKDARITRGRGMMRGMGGRNYPRNQPEKSTRDHEQKEAPKVDDEHAFPSLG